MASDDEDVPDSGAVFTFGKSRFLDNKFWIRDDAVIHVACGDEHSAVVTENGKLYTFGSNDWGQLGHGNTVQFPSPKLVKRLKSEKVKLVAAGRNHTIVSTESGSLFTFGCGSDGQLGHGNCQNSNVPKAIDSLRDQHYKMLACGSDFTAAVTAEGQLYTWGSNSEGQTGHGGADYSIPTKVQMRGKAVAVACGYYHMAVATDDGALYMCGENENGKLGLDESQLRDTTHLQKLFINEHVSAIACGGNHTAAVTANGKLFTFGQGDHGQLGHGPSCLEFPTPKEVTSLGNIHVKYVACGESHTAIITKHRNLYTCGDGRHGKLGMEEESSSNLFKLNKVTRFDGFTVQKVACGGCHTLVTAFKTEINEGTDSEAEAERDILAASVSSTKSLQDAVDGPASYRNGLAATFPARGTARDKRRQRNIESLGNSVGGSLPPISKSALPPLSRPLPALNKEPSKEKKIPVNPLDMSTLPEISQEIKATGRQQRKERERSADKGTKAAKLSEQAKNAESSSGISESEEEDEEDHDEDTDQKKKDQPQFTKKQKGVPKKDEESEESLTQDESESEEEEIAHKNKTVASIKPIISLADKEKVITMEEEKKEEVEEESDEEEESDDEEGEESGAEEAARKPDKNEHLKIEGKKIEVTKLEKRKDEEDDDEEESEEEESEEEEVEENKNKKEQKKTSKRSDAKEKETKAASKKNQSEEDTEEEDEEEEEEEEEEESEGVKETKNVEKDTRAKEKVETKENKDKKEKKKNVEDKKKADDKKEKEKKAKVQGEECEGEEEREEEEGASKDNQKNKGKRDDKQEKSEGQKNQKGKKEDGSVNPETGKTKEKKSGICIVL